MTDYNEDILSRVVSREPVFFLNKGRLPAKEALLKSPVKTDEIYDAEKRLERFAPFFRAAFPETGDGIIESVLKPAFSFARNVLGLESNFYIKCDDSLPVAGSIKARGGIYEILKHAEELVLSGGVKSGLAHPGSDYSVFTSERYREFLSGYRVAVGSTGNLGLSIGIISAKLGFNVTIHMSHDAKEWKKRKLKALGVNVIEYQDAYSAAVEEGRKSCEGDPRSYFVDDENSKDLFLGYSVAALRLEKQLAGMGILPAEGRKLNVYLPCGVGGAPGGISFGLKHVFGDNVRCYFAEPVNAPSVMLGFITGRKINTRDYNIPLSTDADGLAVDSPSELVLNVCGRLIDGLYTVSDERMYKDLYLLNKYEDHKIEVSAAASLCGPSSVPGAGKNDIHIAWLTGGSFVPDAEYNAMLEKGKSIG